MTSEPQHPPCDEPAHQRGKGCGWLHCGYCGEEYDLGQKISRGAFHHFPDGEYAYWAHTGSSARHNAVLNAMAAAIPPMLEQLPASLAEARVHQKLMRNPVFTPLRRLFR